MTMYSDIIVFLRLASFYVGFTLIMALPSYIYELLTLSGSASIIFNIYAHILYYTVLTLAIWFSAPWLSTKIYNFCTIQKIKISMNIDIILQVGLMLILIKGLFEKFILLIYCFLNGIFNHGNKLIAQKSNIIMNFLHSQEAVSTTISFILAIGFIVNYKKVRSFLNNSL